MMCRQIDVEQKSLCWKHWTPPVLVSQHFFDRYVARKGAGDISEQQIAQMVDQTVAFGVAALRSLVSGHLKAEQPVIMPVEGGVGIGDFSFYSAPDQGFEFKKSRQGINTPDRGQDPCRIYFTLRTFVDESMLTPKQVAALKIAKEAYADLTAGPWSENLLMKFGWTKPGEQSEEVMADVRKRLRRFGVANKRIAEMNAFNVNAVESDEKKNRWASPAIKLKALRTTMQELFPGSEISRLSERIGLFERSAEMGQVRDTFVFAR